MLRPTNTYPELLNRLQNAVESARMAVNLGHNTDQHTIRIGELAFQLHLAQYDDAEQRLRKELADEAVELRRLDQASKSPDRHLGSVAE